MPHHQFKYLSEAEWRNKVEQWLLQDREDVIRILKRLDQRPREWFGKLPHAADAAFAEETDASSSIRIIEGILDGDLDPSTNDGQTETTATLSVWSGSGGSWADSGDDETVTNRDDGFCAKAGEYLLCVELESGEIRPIHFPPILRLGKTDAAHNKSASGTVSIYEGTPGSETDTTDNVTSFNKFCDLETTKWIVTARINGKEYLISGEG